MMGFTRVLDPRPMLIAASLLTLVSAEMCSPPTIAIPAVQVQAKYGQVVSMRAEYVGQQPFFIRWNRDVIDPVTNAVTDIPVVSYTQGNNSWPDSVNPRTFAAFYRLENGRISYELQVLQAMCDTQGVYTCHFLAGTDCSINFNVSVIADPLAPVVMNETILAHAGTTVDVICEANVGYPAGDIWWYYVPADGSNIRRITDGIISNTTSSGDCREYMRSTLRVTVNNEDQNSKLRCKTVGRSGQSSVDHVSDGRIAIHGLEPTTPPYSTSCRGESCYGRSGGRSSLTAASAILTHLLVVALAVVVL